MFGTALIVFRESLEAALFVGIVAAATRGLPGRLRWLAAGVIAGVLGALALAAGAGQISAMADGVGQDLVNVGILGAALAMLAWHCIWVSAHAKEMSMQARRLGSSVREGGRKPWALITVVALAVLREGAETVLFVAGLSTGGSDHWTMVAAGAIGGLAGGVGIGALIYFGLSRVKAQHLFQVTNALILLLAGAIASQLARALAQAGLVDAWSTALWDSSHVLPTDSALGVLLHALAGYDAQPSGLQLAFYAGTVVLITLAARRVRQRQGRAGPARGPVRARSC
ncbi:FTR1 family iron permease [Ramlibacter sp.]|uniref:FTR1 family iron permease n=1 Tax=Ramlibacter sp. TaxID=1917967 RepID=UPI002BD34C44|nr:FTR1 family protein [Ramlibacter sp.]HWI82815.1 FTR1 family protein [Ramlibacter sp.]